jgi:exodeoxyribonuclease VII large subunit
VAAVDYFNQLAEPVDVLVLIRGGGSLEDLAAFSTEPVARAVAASRTPIIVGVGHEVDVSLADYAADVRAATPTDAARLVVPDRSEIGARVAHAQRQLVSCLTASTVAKQTHITRALGRLEGYLRHPRERVSAYEATLWRSLDRLGHERQRSQDRTGLLTSRLGNFENLILARHYDHIHHLDRLLRGFDPAGILARGYAIARTPDGAVLRDPAGAPVGTMLSVQLAKGQLTTQVTSPASRHQESS